MGWQYRRRRRVGRRGWLNMSRRGVSLSERLGPMTVNSRGRVTFRFGRGLFWRGKI